MALRDILVVFGIEVDQTPLAQAQKKADGLLDTFRRGLPVIQAFGAAFAVRALVQTADAFATMNNRIRNVTQGTEDFASAQERLIDVSRDTYQPVENVVESFQRYSIATKSLGLSQEEVIDFTKRLTQATVLSGASAAETNGALIQLAQGLSTNFKAAGQEIRSLQENAPQLAEIIAKAAGGSAGDLMQFAKAGKITSKLVVDAVRSAGAELDVQFAKRLPTYAEAFGRIRTEWMLLVGALNEQSGLGKFVTGTLVKFADVLKDLTPRVREFARSGRLLQAALAIFGATFLRYAILKNLGSLVGWLFRAQAGFRLLWRLLLRFALPVLIIDELITLFRGGDTLIGRFIDKMFGIGAAAKGIEAINTVVQSLFDTLSLLLGGDTEDWEMAFLRASDGIGKVFDALFEKIGGAFDRLLIAIGSGIVALARKLPGGELIFGKEGAEFDPEGNAARGASLGMGNLPSVPSIAPPPTLSDAAARRAVADGRVPPGAAPQVTNNITVEGAATPAVAREIAARAGAATGAAMGRDRAAIGASVGVGS